MVLAIFDGLGGKVSFFANSALYSNIRGEFSLFIFLFM